MKMFILSILIMLFLYDDVISADSTMKWHKKDSINVYIKPIYKRFRINLYSGYSNNFILKYAGLDLNKIEGFVYGFGLEYSPSVKDNWSIEISRFRFPYLRDDSHSFSQLTSHSIIFSFYYDDLLSKNFKDVIFKWHFGSGGLIPIPVFSWDLGLGIEYKPIDNIRIQLEGRFILNMIGSFGGGGVSYPSIITFGTKFNL